MYDFPQKTCIFCHLFFAAHQKILKGQMNQSYGTAKIMMSLSSGPHREHLNPIGILETLTNFWCSLNINSCSGLLDE